MIRLTTNTATVPISFRVAVEHFTWAKAAGLSNSAILVSISLPAPGNIADRTVIDALERTWLAMQMGFKARAMTPANHHLRRAAQ